RRTEAMTPKSWLEAHAYLRPLAELSAEVERAADEIAIPEAPLPDWDDYRAGRPRSGRPNGSGIDRETGLGSVVRMARGGGARAPCGVAARPSRGAPHRRSSAGGPERCAAIRRVDALSGLGRHGTIHWSDRDRLQQLARRGEVASQVLPD